MDSILVDTSAYFAVLDKTDKNHNKAINFLTNNTYPLITTNIIVIETINLVNARLSASVYSFLKCAHKPASQTL